MDPSFETFAKPEASRVKGHIDSPLHGHNLPPPTYRFQDHRQQTSESRDVTRTLEIVTTIRAIGRR